MSLEFAAFSASVGVWTALILPALVTWRMGRDFFGRFGGQPLTGRMSARWGWFLMELPALVVLPAAYLAFSERHVATDIIVIAWVAHYAHRTLVWPLVVPQPGDTITVATCVAGFGFNIVNGLLFGWFITRLADYPAEWITDARFILGASVMLAGALLNIWSDHHLAKLRRDNPGQRVLPYRGPFRFISSPNLAGEIVEWAGFALMSWSLPGLSFALWTAANLTPRALWRRRWYEEQFSDYPATRKALIPKLL